MKKWTPQILCAVFALWILSGLKPQKPVDGFNLTEFGQLPVLHGGRVQPLDSYARNTLLQIRGKQTVSLKAERDKRDWEKQQDPALVDKILDEGKSRLSATEWLVEAAFEPETSDRRPLFLVHHPELKSMLELSEGRKYFSWLELTNHISDLEHEADRVRLIDSEARNPFDKQIANLHRAMGLYHRTKNSFQIEGAGDFSRELELFEQVIPAGLQAAHSGSDPSQWNSREIAILSELFQRYQRLAQMALPWILPPAEKQENDEGWANLGNGLMESMRTAEVHPMAMHYAKLGAAWQSESATDFNSALGQANGWLEAKGQKAAIKKAGLEVTFNQVEPFYRCMVVYVTALVLVFCFWLNNNESYRRNALWIIGLAFVVHTFGLIFRMVLEGRPPVTNLYSSAVFVGWGAVGLSLILERFFRGGIGLAVASVVGFCTLIVAHHLSLSGDTLEMLQAVLDTNFWLATHVVIITLGYSAMFVAGILAIIYVIRGVFSRNLDSATGKSLVRMVYAIVCFSTLASFVGTILGGIWADQSWGRFWGWDPKENGALMIVIWCAVILHARWGGLIRERGLMATAIFGNVVTSYSWFGVNMLGVGLHSYGFMDKAFPWLMGFIGSQLVLIALAVLPWKYWASCQALAPASALPKNKPSGDDSGPSGKEAMAGA